MIRSRASTGSTAPFRLLYSVREPGAVFYRDDLLALSDCYTKVSLTYAYTRIPPKDWPRPPGRIDGALIADVTWPSNLAPTCYVCGPTPFVESAVGFLSASGNSSDRIRTEHFVLEWRCFYSPLVKSRPIAQTSPRKRLRLTRSHRYVRESAIIGSSLAARRAGR